MQITINAEPREWPKPLISYEELVEAAGMKGNPSALYSGPRNGDSKRSGILAPGTIIMVDDGMHFSVCHTGNA